MKNYAYKVGAVFYGLWGMLHIVGAAVLLQQVSTGGAAVVLTTIGSATPPAAVPAVSGGLLDAVLAYYAWQILWIGLLVLIVAIWLNWKNSRTGYWLNLVVVGAVDLGLVFTLIAPGHMALMDGGLGLALFLPAAVFSTIGLLNPNSQSVKQTVPA